MIFWPDTLTTKRERRYIERDKKIVSGELGGFSFLMVGEVSAVTRRPSPGVYKLLDPGVPSGGGDLGPKNLWHPLLSDKTRLCGKRGISPGLRGRGATGRDRNHLSD